ncbi:MAG: type II toxin-antitoxin system HicB family antitoxin [Leptospirales bacterium]
MKDVIVHNDFIGSVHFSTEDEIFFGKIEGITDLVTFEGETVKDLKKAFEEAVADYIELCESSGKEIYKSYKGSFNIRISPELHKKAVEIAQLSGLSLNQFVENAIEHEVVNIA